MNLQKTDHRIVVGDELMNYGDLYALCLARSAAISLSAGG